MAPSCGPSRKQVIVTMVIMVIQDRNLEIFRQQQVPCPKYLYTNDSDTFTAKKIGNRLHTYENHDCLMTTITSHR